MKNGVYFCCSVYLSFSLSYANTTSPTHRRPVFFLLPLSFPLKLTVWGHSFSCRPMSLPPCMLLCSYDFHLILYILNITKNSQNTGIIWLRSAGAKFCHRHMFCFPEGPAANMTCLNFSFGLLVI